MEEKRIGDWMMTFTGIKFWPIDPRAEEVDIEDIAHALSNMCRFNGHCRRFYSVTQHCVLASEQSKYPLHALLHDAAEAYIGDLGRPVKRALRSCQNHWYDNAEEKIMEQIWNRFDLISPEICPDIKEDIRNVDTRMLATERFQLMGPGTDWTELHGVEPYKSMTIIPWAPEVAEAVFLNSFRRESR